MEQLGQSFSTVFLGAPDPILTPWGSASTTGAAVQAPPPLLTGRNAHRASQQQQQQPQPQQETEAQSDDEFSLPPCLQCLNKKLLLT